MYAAIVLIYKHAAWIGPWPYTPLGNSRTGWSLFFILACFLVTKRSGGVLQAMGRNKQI